MKSKGLSLKVAAVFIGTVVGAGLASGQEILQFFTVYSIKGIWGIFLCGILYIITGLITVDLSYKYKASSYNELVYLSCGKYLGWIVDILTTLFLFGGICIILAGSGSIFYESFGLPFIVGAIIMAVATFIIVIKSTNGLMFINSIIVPCMIIIIGTISAIVIFKKLTLPYGIFSEIINTPSYKHNWFLSTLLYLSFNMLSATGVISPMTRDIEDQKSMSNGIIFGSVGLFILTCIMNIILLLNEPNIFKYSLPMLYIAESIGTFAHIALSIMIWMEMFTTAISDVYSLAKKIVYTLKLNYKFSIVLILLSAFPFSFLGFNNLISVLYPLYGFISLIYIINLILLYIKTYSIKSR